MTRLLDKLTIATLCLVVLALLWRRAKDSEVAKRDDPLNLTGFEERSKQYDREINLEGTNRL